MNPWWWARFLDLAQLLWWGFVCIAGLGAAALIGINLANMKKGPPG